MTVHVLTLHPIEGSTWAEEWRCTCGMTVLSEGATRDDVTRWHAPETEWETRATCPECGRMGLVDLRGHRRKSHGYRVRENKA